MTSVQCKLLVLRLLDILAARKDPKGQTGHVLINGAPQPENFKCMAGYVIQVSQKIKPRKWLCSILHELRSHFQDDIVVGMLTVRENIAFSAALRLPSSMSTSERNTQVEDVINDLGLTKCADTRVRFCRVRNIALYIALTLVFLLQVGTEFIRGVSGGERKRTNIAMELITSPQVLFLDEPTTGLDANTAYSVIHLLKRLGFSLPKH